jgi:hypothetical protein
MRRRPRIAAVSLAFLFCAVACADAATTPLIAAGRSLVPAGRDFVVRDRIRERACVAGRTSVRCVEFAVESRTVRLTARLSLFAATARRHGWTLARTQHFNNGGAVVYLKRGAFRAVLGFGNNRLWSGGPVTTLVRVTLPATAQHVGLPPVRIDSRVTGPAKRRFVALANAACRAGVSRILHIPKATSPSAGAKRYRVELDRTIHAIAALRPPPEDERAVSRVLAEFRRFSQAIQLLIDAKGENALGAAAAIAVTGKRARAAANAYGLSDCAKLVGA